MGRALFFFLPGLMLWMGSLTCLGSESIYHHRFQTFEDADNFVQNIIIETVRDQQGFLWIATQSGLTRFDGYRFTGYFPNPNDEHALSHGWVNALHIDALNQLWVGTRGGLHRYLPEKDHFQKYATHPNHSPQDNRVLDITSDHKGQLWVGTQSGLFLMEDQRFVQKSYHPEATRDQNAHSTRFIFADQNLLWIGTTGGSVFRYDLETETSEALPMDHPKPSGVQFIGKDSTDRIWAGLRTGGLQFYQPEQQKFVRVQILPEDPHSILNQEAYAFEPIKDGGFWLGLRNGLAEINPTIPNPAGPQDYHVTLIRSSDDPDGLNSGRIYSLFLEENGVLWIGGLKLLKLPPMMRAFGHVKATNRPGSMLDNHVWSLCEDSTGAIWVGSSSGLSRLTRNSERFETYKHNPNDPNSIIFNDVNYIMEDSQNRLWILFHDRGLCLYNREENHFTRYPYAPEGKDGLQELPVMLENRHGELMVGTSTSGVARFHPETGDFEHIRLEPDQTRDSAVFAMEEDGRGRLWIGTVNNGLYQLNQGMVQHYAHQSGDRRLISNQIMDLHLDADTGLWIATGAGLDHLNINTGQITHYRKEQGLPDNTIYAIQEDNQNRLWLGTARGLSCYDGQTGTFLNYGYDDGLQGDDFNNHSAFKLKDGRLMFGGVNGFNLFHPKEIQFTNQKPITALTGFYLFNKEMIPSREGPLTKPIGRMGELILSHQHDFFSLEFATLDSENPKMNRNLFMLENRDNHWFETRKGQRIATYTDLGPGDYVFRVKGAGPGGTWGPETRLKIRMNPPPWRSWWAYTIYVLTVLALIQGYLARQRRKLNDERTINEKLLRADKLKDAFLELVEEAHRAGMAEIAANMLHDLGNRVNSIQTSVHLIREQTGERKEIESVNRLADLLHQHQEDLPRFMDQNGEKVLAMLRQLAQRLDKRAVTLEKEAENLDSQLLKTRDALKEQRQHVRREERFLEPCDLNHLITDVASMQESLMKEAGIQVTHQLSTNPMETAVERSKFIRILYDLLNNAREALTDEEQGMIKLISKRDHNGLVVEIWDNGCGFSPEVAQKLFLPDFTTREGHRGYGLHHCANAAKEMSATLEVTSEGPGKGARARLTLPILNGETSPGPK